MQLDGLATAVSPGGGSSHRSLETAVNGNTVVNHMATPTSPATPLKMPAHSVAMPTPLLQAVYDRNSQQPRYILQSPGPPGSSGGPTLIPVQGIQMAPPSSHQHRSHVTNNNGSTTFTLSTPTLTLPAVSMHVDQLAGNVGMSSLQTPPPSTPKLFGSLGPQAFQIAARGPGLRTTQGILGTGMDGLLPPSHMLLPHCNNGSTQHSEAGPIRTIVRQAAKERPSPVAMDGELEHLVCCHGW